MYVVNAVRHVYACYLRYHAITLVNTSLLLLRNTVDEVHGGTRRAAAGMFTRHATASPRPCQRSFIRQRFRHAAPRQSCCSAARSPPRRTGRDLDYCFHCPPFQPLLLHILVIAFLHLYAQASGSDLRAV